MPAFKERRAKKKGIGRKVNYNPTRLVTAGLLITYCFFMPCCKKVYVDST